MIYVNKKMEREVKKEGEFLYFLQIGEVKNGIRRVKIGTTNNMMRRMKEHSRSYDEDIYVLWCKRLSSKWTTLMKEDSNKEFWKQYTNWTYKRNDRFDIPADLDSVQIKIRKIYEIPLSCMCFPA